MPRKIDMQDQHFGRLLVIAESGRDAKGDVTWLCRCDCGGEAVVSGSNLRTGNTTSCGCFRLEQLRKKATRHGKRHTRVYTIWLNMVQRCTNPLNTSFADYGGRSINVCPEWRNFQQFYADMGDPPDGTSLDRIDVNGDYCKANCQWATKDIQSRNTRANRRVTYQGSTKTLIEWSEDLGIDYWTLHARFRRGWSVARAFTTLVEE
jgi:hypothetical protein